MNGREHWPLWTSQSSHRIDKTLVVTHVCIEFSSSPVSPGEEGASDYPGRRKEAKTQLGGARLAWKGEGWEMRL